jgi:hypothetical protein
MDKTHIADGKVEYVASLNTGTMIHQVLNWRGTFH